MSAERISVGNLSETWPTAPRAEFDAPLMIERSFPSLAQEVDFDPLEAEARQLLSLGAPFRPVLDVRRVNGVVEVVQERFVGLSSEELVAALAKGHRLLPLDVWLGLAELLCRGWSSVPPGSAPWRLVPTIASCGVDVRRRVLLFPEPQHSLALEWARDSTRVSYAGTRISRRLENYSPEHLSGGAVVSERSRVFSLATVLVELLTLDRPFHRSSELTAMQATLTGDARWRPTHHPHCPAALGQVLGSALARGPGERPATLDALRALLLEAAGCAPASSQRIANVVLGVDPAAVRRTLSALRAQPEFLPTSWREGGLDVLEDQLLETLGPFEELPVSRAPARVSPAPRVNLGSPQPAPPRVNLAPGRRSWWQAIWPFGRS